ncbi:MULTISPECIES: hypothetical protein [Novosphingobium]|uniref:Uncharacterized protein n=1 Tax=Novosphingobium pentaromativorans US6-1 TaxID=1088721 RepID=G6EEV3_9SPHN|nr:MULTISPECIES: hypothetical protein [Novosphingobium]EHJ60168.1 hypothetical protein NSU_2874 [Novosphingobium pentaromativorans US6-1]
MELLSDYQGLQNRAAFDSAGRLWQGARPDAAGMLDFARLSHHQDTEFTPGSFGPER